MLIFLMVVCFVTLTKVRAVEDDKIVAPYALSVEVGRQYEVACTLIRDHVDDTDTVTDTSPVYRCVTAVPPGQQFPSASADIIVHYGNGDTYKVGASECGLMYFENLFSFRIEPDSVKGVGPLKPISISDFKNPPTDNEYELHVRIYEGERVELITEKLRPLLADYSQCFDFPLRSPSLDWFCFQAEGGIGTNFIGGSVVNNDQLWGLTIDTINETKEVLAAVLSDTVLAKFRPVNFATTTVAYPAQGEPPPYVEGEELPTYPPRALRTNARDRGTRLPVHPSRHRHLDLGPDPEANPYYRRKVAFATIAAMIFIILMCVAILQCNTRCLSST